ncbi:Uncharacterised protein [Bordetella pertussis]|nr:Uncharacterised protein [Bordetella pertussis]CFO00577.1 Uncharacterised protein [Bordetella pertussis]CFO31164.1 Uncharacterised protein [Bordetella pertussis]CFP04555.1 Uncharacterised protein [Bordetella pertussis]CFP12309.1 Uncharacterised protein [Bordetella pertussis]
MPAMPREPSGTRVEVLCGQPEQNHGLRSTTRRGRASACSRSAMKSRRAWMPARTSSGSSKRSRRAPMALATMAGENS